MPPSRAALEIGLGLAQQGFRLGLIAADIQEQARGRSARCGFHEGQGGLARGHSPQIVEMDAQAIGQFGPLGLHLAPKSSSKGFITGWVMSWPSWVLFHCSVRRMEFVAETNPTVVFGKSVSMGGGAAKTKFGPMRPQTTSNESTGRKLGTAELLLRE